MSSLVKFQVVISKTQMHEWLSEAEDEARPGLEPQTYGNIDQR